jgi:flagellar motor switch protein FliG
MTIGQSITYLDISKALGIPRDRYEHITSYISRMTRDYQGNVVDIIKEIPLNLKGKERYFAMFLVGRYSSQLFSSVNNEQQGELIMEIIGTLKTSQDMAKLITDEIENKVLKNTREYDDTSIIDMMKKVIDRDLKDVEKDYMSFALGLIYI